MRRIRIFDDNGDLNEVNCELARLIIFKKDEDGISQAQIIFASDHSLTFHGYGAKQIYNMLTEAMQPVAAPQP